MYHVAVLIDGKWIEGGTAYATKEEAVAKAKALHDIILDNGFDLGVRIVDRNEYLEDSPGLDLADTF